jgi:amicyanin
MKKLYLRLGCILIILLAVSGCTTYNPSSTTPTATLTTPSSTTSLAPTTPSVMTITIQNFAFNPPSLSISAGTTVTWTNQDTVQHQIINDATSTFGQGQQFESNPLGQGQSYSFTFNEIGTYPYHCNIHPSMKGTIIVM